MTHNGKEHVMPAAAAGAAGAVPAELTAGCPGAACLALKPPHEQLQVGLHAVPLLALRRSKRRSERVALARLAQAVPASTTRCSTHSRRGRQGSCSGQRSMRPCAAGRPDAAGQPCSMPPRPPGACPRPCQPAPACAAARASSGARPSLRPSAHCGLWPASELRPCQPAGPLQGGPEAAAARAAPHLAAPAGPAPAPAQLPGPAAAAAAAVHLDPA